MSLRQCTTNRKVSSSNFNSNFQSKEEHYRTLNAQLEVKTSELLREADSVLRNAQTLSQDDGRLALNDPVLVNQNEILNDTPRDVDPVVNVSKTLEEETTDSQTDFTGTEVLPEPAQRLSLKAQNRYLQARVRVLQEEFQKISGQLRASYEDNTSLKKRVQELEAERNRLQRTTSGHTAQTDKMKKSLEETKTACDVLTVERNALKKENDALKRSSTQQGAELKSVTSRLHRVTEDVERLKAELEKSRSQSRETTDSMKHTVEHLTVENRRLDRQKTELIAAFKKQLRLIDVLKRQKMLIEASKCLQLTEEEFLKSLDWKG